MELPITILGSNGWIGSALKRELLNRDISYISIDRKTIDQWIRASNAQGPVIYTIGITSDFREKPYETIEGHVSLLSRVIRRRGISRFLYLSSSRVYIENCETNEESNISVNSANPSDLYNLSKLLGESLVLNDSRPGMCVARISNVVGPNQPVHTFLGSLLNEIKVKGETTILQSHKSAKDYIHLEDLVDILVKMSACSRHRMYNIGYGRNKTHKELAQWLESQGAIVNFAKSPETGPNAPPLDIKRMVDEFGQPMDPFANRLIF